MRQTLSFTRVLLDAIPRGRWRLIAAILLAFAASAASVALMGVAAFLLSWAALFPPVLYLQAPAVGVRFFGISRGVLRYVERLVGHDLALRMQGALRLRVYDKLSGTTLIGRRRGDLLTRVVADVDAIQDLVVRVIIPITSATLVIATTTVLLGLFNWPSALVLLATALLGGVLLPWWAQRASLRADEASVEARGRLADEVRELSRVGGDLVANGADAEALNRLLAVDDDLRRHESRGAGVRGLATAGQIVAAGVAVVAALAIGAPALVAGTLDPRFLAILVLTPLALHETFAAFTQAAQTYTRSRTALSRIAAELDAPPVGEGDVTPGGLPHARTRRGERRLARRAGGAARCVFEGRAGRARRPGGPVRRGQDHDRGHRDGAHSADRRTDRAGRPRRLSRPGCAHLRYHRRRERTNRQ